MIGLRLREASFDALEVEPDGTGTLEDLILDLAGGRAFAQRCRRAGVRTSSTRLLPRRCSSPSCTSPQFDSNRPTASAAVPNS